MVLGNKYAQNVERLFMEHNKENISINKSKLLYILDFFDEYLIRFIQEVLADSEDDPHFSAVAAQNMIVCYLEIMADLGQKLPYSNVKEYFEFQGFEPEEYCAFEESRRKESDYYGGPQF